MKMWPNNPVEPAAALRAGVAHLKRRGSIISIVNLQDISLTKPY
jgi:hypothetical protein